MVIERQMSETRIKQLAQDVSKANHDYYNDSPTVSDKVYDAWKDELQDLVNNCKNKKLVAQVTLVLNSIGAMVGVSEWRKAAHDIPMGSLNKVNTPDELGAWAKECSATEIFLTEKLDGISINTIWKDGTLVQAITRGDGSVGEEITPNVKKMQGIPKTLNKKFTGSLRGEIVLKKTDHKVYFPEYSNPRNAASGVAKRFDGDGSEHLTVMIYQAFGVDFKTEQEQFAYLDKLGVIVPEHSLHKDIKSAIIEYKRYHNSAREKLDYDIDGLVCRVNSMSDQLALGDKNHRPKGAIAFKFEAEARETILNNIVWQVGSTGRITPVAEFDPVTLVGAKISRASLYNYSYIKELGVDIGAKVIVVRANDVIPRVEEVSKGTGKTIKPPAKCPECDGKTEMNGEYLLCTNKTTCPAQALGRLKIWVSENNILEWGDKMLQKVLDNSLVKDVADLYKLTTDDLKSLDRMGEKSAKNLVDVLNKHKDVPLENLIGGLGIENVATSTVKLVIKAGNDTLDSINKMSIADFEAIDGFGAIKAQAFYDGMKSNKNRIQDIINAGVTIKARIKGKLMNKSFCFTGAMSQPRPKLQAMVIAAGGDVKKSVGKGLDYLVVSDPSAGTAKIKAAQKNGVKCISEVDFLAMAN